MSLFKIYQVKKVQNSLYNILPFVLGGGAISMYTYLIQETLGKYIK